MEGGREGERVLAVYTGSSPLHWALTALLRSLSFCLLPPLPPLSPLPP